MSGIARSRAAWMFGLALLAATGASGPGRAEPAPLVVGVENIDYFPHYTYRDGEYGGFGRDVLDAFAKAEGLRLIYRPLPVARLYVQFLAGEVDLKYPDNRLWQADQKAGKAVVYSDPVAEFIDGVSVRPEQVGRGRSAIKRLGQVLGFSAIGWQDDIARGTVTLISNPNLEALITLTIDGRVDGAYGNVAIVDYVLTHVMKRPAALMYDPGLPHVSDFYALSTIKRPDVIATFNAWMKRDAAAIEALKRRYHLVPAP